MEGFKEFEYYVLVVELMEGRKFINHAVRYDVKNDKSIWIWDKDTVRNYTGLQLVDTDLTPWNREYMEVDKTLYDYTVEMITID